MVVWDSLDCVVILYFKLDTRLFSSLLLEGCKSLDQLNLTIPVAGHPASPAHPLSGCPVPSVPPAAEPVPHLQTPNSDPQTMARECPQSSKPPSGSKSGLRNTTGCLHASDSKAAGGHSHPKQQRISRRRATNGWIPVGAACEKAVYVVVGVWSADLCVCTAVPICASSGD